MAQDLYGNATAGSFISALSRLLTYYLQMEGFTCGYDDLLLVKRAERARSALLDTAETAALAASARFVGEEVPQLMQGADGAKPKPQSDISVRESLLQEPVQVLESQWCACMALGFSSKGVCQADRMVVSISSSSGSWLNEELFPRERHPARIK